MKPVFESNGISIYQGDSRELLRNLPDESVHCCVTSPPYWGLRDYGVSGQIGLESTPYEYISTMRMLFAEVRRVLRADGTLWLNMGDSYASTPPGCQNGGVSESSTLHGVNGKSGTYRETLRQSVGRRRNTIAGGLKPKDLCGIPWMLAFALREDGWYLRQDIIWAKPNPMPESVTDRCTKAHEYIFLLSKSERYYYNQQAILEPIAAASAYRLQQDVESQNGSDRVPGKTNGNMKAVSRKAGNKSHKYVSAYQESDTEEHRTKAGLLSCAEKEWTLRNRRSVWEVTTQPFPEAHFATFPEDLIKPCILAGCPEGGTVLDPFGGAGTTGLVARKLHCKAILLELNSEYIDISAKRLQQEVFQFGESKAL